MPPVGAFPSLLDVSCRFVHTMSTAELDISGKSKDSVFPILLSRKMPRLPLHNAEDVFNNMKFFGLKISICLGKKKWRKDLL